MPKVVDIRTCIRGIIQVAAIAVIACVASATTWAQGSSGSPAPNLAERQIAYRKAVFTVLAGNFGPLAQVVQGKAPYDAAEVERRVTRVAVLVEMIGDAFPDTSRQGETRATADIWSNPSKFAAAVKEIQVKSAALAQLVGTDKTSSSAFQKAVSDLSAACKGCHDDFRAR